MSRHPWRYGMALGGLCGLAALAGYGLGWKVPHEGEPEGGAGTPTRDGSSRNGTPPDMLRPSAASIPPQPRTPDQLAALKVELQRKFSENHNPWMDSTLRAQTAALLSTLTPEELAAYHPEVDVAAKGPAFFTTWQAALAREVLRQWGLKDPAAAAVAEARAKNLPQAYVFDDWMRRDPAAAEKWLLEGDPGSDPAKTKMLQKLLLERAKENPAEADVLLAKLPENDRESALRSWSRNLANDPENRAKLLAIIDGRGDEALREKCYGDIISAMTAKSPEDAGNFLENSALSEDAKDRMMDRLIGSWAHKNPEEAFRWWAALKEPAARPGLVKAMKEWYFQEREAPVHMIHSLEHGTARSTFESEAIGLYTSVDDFSCATKIAGAIKDDEARIRQMRIIKRSWDEKSESASAAWQATLPQKDRAALE